MRCPPTWGLAIPGGRDSADVMTHGWDATQGCFVQVYGEPWLDASLLVVPMIRFLRRADPRVRTSLAGSTRN